MLLAARLARVAAAAATCTAVSTSARVAAPRGWPVAAAAAPQAFFVHDRRRRSCAAAASGNSSSSSCSHIEPPDVRKLAAMATIAVTDEEVAAWEPTLQKIAGWFDQLQAVDVEGVPPATDAGVGGAGLREDTVDGSLAGVEDALGQAPEREGAFIKVPKVL